jgi:hypothetical protein
MSTSGLDDRTIEKVGGPAWSELRLTFMKISESLLAVSESSRGELTTIYVKYASDETRSKPFAVVWLRKSSELTIGLALPDDVASEAFVDMPKGCKYAGLTRYLVLSADTGVPDEFNEWASTAFRHVSQLESD